MYDYYFEKDVALAYFLWDPGHRHDWEHIVVFTTQGDDAAPVAVAASQHGGYETKAAADVRWDGDRPKMVYHKDGLSTHNFRFASAADDDIENDLGVWFYGPLVSYNGFPSTALRGELMAADFGDANINIKDASFADSLERARGDYVPGFDSSVDDGSPGDP